MSQALADYLLRFDDEAAFQNWTPPSGAKLNPVKPITARATYEQDGEDITITSPEQVASGYWVQVFTTEAEEAIKDMPECVARGYRSNGWKSPVPEQYGLVAIDGLWMGSELS